jgi:N-acetylmuramoyl-L-alanine amidase
MACCISKPRKNKFGLVAGFLCAVLSFGADGSKVTAVRFWSLGDVTRVAIEVSSDFHYKAERLASPERLFFDIIGARPEMVAKGMHVITVGDALLKDIRIAETQPGVTRVVLDLEHNAEFTASQLSSPDRLMIEVRAKDGPAPPPTASVSGAKNVAAAPVQPVEADLVATHLSTSVTTTVVEVAKPAPKKFEPPPDQPGVPAETKPELLAPPSLAVAYRTARVTSPAPPVSVAMARVTPPAEAIPDPVTSAPVAMAALATPPLATLPLATPPLARPTTTEPLPAKKNANGDRSLTRVLGLKLGRVVLDPGHGGHDAGTHGPSGLLEKDVVLDVSRRLGALLESRLNTEVIYTRSDDTYIPLEQRTQIANDRKADVFLSIHANSSPYHGVSGVETYYLNFTTSKMALDVFSI